MEVEQCAESEVDVVLASWFKINNVASMWNYRKSFYWKSLEYNQKLIIILFRRIKSQVCKKFSTKLFYNVIIMSSIYLLHHVSCLSLPPCHIWFWISSNYSENFSIINSLHIDKIIVFTNIIMTSNFKLEFNLELIKFSRFELKLINFILINTKDFATLRTLFQK